MVLFWEKLGNVIIRCGIIAKKRKNSTRILRPPFWNPHSNNRFDDFSNVTKGEVQSRAATFSPQDHGHHIKRVLPGPVNHFGKEFCQIN